MVVKVIDASALGALLFGEPEAKAIADKLDGARLVAPTLLAFEIANVFVIKCRRHPELVGTLSAAFALRKTLAIEDVSVDDDAIVATAQATGLTAYDASYLCLARQLSAELVTLDGELAAAFASNKRRHGRSARTKKT